MRNFFILFFLINTVSYSRIEGCTDKLASNYNPKATKSNCECWYENVKVKPKFTAKLSDSIPGTSGIIPFDGLLWTHNDHFAATFYGLDLKGNIKKKVDYPELKCHDWEDIAQDNTYIYIGDFGNNYTGNRKDLKILRIQKKSFYNTRPEIDTIAFSYPNQKDFTVKKPQTTDFDCEAFVVSENNIYLFTKQWRSEKTTVYELPKKPGNYIAQQKTTIDVDGLITGATALPSHNGVVLCGYSKLLQPFLVLLYDYQNDAVCAGNKRKIKLGLPFHQIEAITTEDGKLFYLTNEATVRKPFVNTRQQFHTIDLSAYLKP
jgi:hypothetical protein